MGTALYRTASDLLKSDTLIAFHVRCCSDANAEEIVALAKDREHAKRLAKKVFGDDPEKYVVEPRTDPGTSIIFEF